MAKVKYPKGGGKKRSPFFALVKGADSLIPSFCNPRTVIGGLKKNSRNRDKVFTVNSN